MDDCPHCGEPLDDDASSCPHCGSDFETGWNPDAEYYGVELPEEDEPAPPGARPAGGAVRPRELRAGHLGSLCLVAAAALLFFWVVALTLPDRPASLAAALVLSVSLFLFFRRLGRNAPREPR
jgi:hypothetical protein